MFFRLMFLLHLTVFILLCSCGSGTVVGNPDITGRVVSSDGTPVCSCKVVLGARDEDPGIVTIEPGTDQLKIVLHSKPFRTVYTDKNGVFVFDTVGQGAYCIVAGQDNLMGIYEKIYPFDEDDINVGDIKIKSTSKLTIDNYSSIMDTSSKNFIVARIDGTDITSKEDIKDRIYFSAIPEGVYDIILYRKNDSVEYIKALDVAPNDSMTIQVNPLIPPEEWTYRKLHRIVKGRPYVVRYAFEAAPISSTYRFKHYCWILFSHPMQTRVTDNAIKVFSSDSLTKIEKVVQWQGSDQVLIDLCSNNTANCQEDTSSLKKGITYSIVIDTTAISSGGYTLAWPDTLKLTP